MGFKVRGYNRDSKGKERDCSLFAISAEGSETEPNYFEHFDGINNIKVDVVDNEGTASSPDKVLERALKYAEDLDLKFADDSGDSMWLVVDVDKWKHEQLQLLDDHCKKHKNWHVVISNPCFEIWLLYHFFDELDDDFDCSTARKTKQTRNDKLPHNQKYGMFEYYPHIVRAIANAKRHDTDLNHYLPQAKQTKVYMLANTLLQRIGTVRYQKFLDQYVAEKKHEIDAKIAKKKKENKKQKK